MNLRNNDNWVSPVGHHYIPKEYLKGFAVPGTCDSDFAGFVWQFDKKVGKFGDKAASIEKVAQQSQFYEEDTEANLNRYIEKPANAVFDKLRARDFGLTEHDRRKVAWYIATMVKRVPKHRAFGFKYAPTVLREVTDEYREMVQSARENRDLDGSVARKYLDEIDAVEDKFRDDPPEEVVQQIKNPWPRIRDVGLIYDMHWRYVVTDGPQYFITSDCPVFTFGVYGLIHRRAELTFPVSYDVAIVATWTPVRRSDQVISDNQIRKETNRRTAHQAHRFVYYRERRPWIAKIAGKQDPYFHQINFESIKRKAPAQ